MFVHHLLPLVERQLVPLSGLDERIDEQVLRVSGMQFQSLTPALLTADIDRRAGHGQVGIGHRQVWAHWCPVDEACELLDILQLVADLPEQKIGVAARADEAVAADLEAVRERLYCVRDCSRPAFALA